MKPIIFHPEASDELEKASTYYDELQTGLGHAFTDTVDRAVARIQQFPTAGAVYEDTDFREVVLRRFPYVIYYVELEEAVWIIAVAHGTRRPGYWQMRTPR